MRFKGVFRRAVEEINYVTRENWSYAEVGEFWDSVHNYDAVDHDTYAYDRRFTDSYKINNLKDNGFVLDICCRTGNGSSYYHRKGKIQKVVCADVSNDFLRIAKGKLENENVNFELVLFDGLPLPFDDDMFDSVLCFETVEHFPNPGEFIAELARVCKKNGSMIITTPNVLWEPVHWFAAIFDIHHSEGPHRFIPRKRLIESIQNVNLEIVKETTTVIVAHGPDRLVEMGEKVEHLLGESIRRNLALRRILVCKKN